MKIRIFSDIHLDVNQKFPFSFKDGDKDIFTLIPGDISGNVKLTARWVKDNIHNGMFIVGNHDPTYNDLPMTVEEQKVYLANRFTMDSNVTFLDELVGEMSKPIPDTNILVVGSTLYTDYKYMTKRWRDGLASGNERRREHGEHELTVEEVNMSVGARGLNDFRWGHVKDTIEIGKMMPLSPRIYKDWFDRTFKKIQDIVEANPTKDIIVMTHHCPSGKLLAEEYVESQLNASYVSDLEDFILSHPNIKAWCCGHVHNVKLTEIGDRGQLLICNPRGYERNFESTGWTPNVILDTDTWTVESLPFESKKLKAARDKYFDSVMPFAGCFM